MLKHTLMSLYNNYQKKGYLLGITLAYSTTSFAQEKDVPPPSGSLPHYGEDIAEMMFSLALVVGLIFIIAWLFKRVSNTNIMPNKVMDIKACLPLSPKEKLMIVQVGDEQIVVGVAPGFVGLIKTLEQPLVNNASKPSLVQAKESFAKTLEKVLKGKGKATMDTHNNV